MTNDDGATPLHVGSLHGRVAIVDLLLRRGANPAVTDLVGNAPLHAAAELASVDVMQLLIDRRPNSLWRRNIVSFLAWAAAAKRSLPAAFYDAEDLRELVWSFLRLPEPADVDFASHRDGMTALMCVAGGGHLIDQFHGLRPQAHAYVSAARFLVDNDARLETQDDQGRTALQISGSESSLLDEDGKQLMLVQQEEEESFRELSYADPTLAVEITMALSGVLS